MRHALLLLGLIGLASSLGAACSEDPSAVEVNSDEPKKKKSTTKPEEVPAKAGIVEEHSADRVMLYGMIVSPDEAFEGEVLIEGGTIVCVAEGKGCDNDSSATDATLVQTAGLIFPGLIDTHNHVLFDIFDGQHWLPLKAYQNHDEWPNEARYKAMLDVKQCLGNEVGKPADCPTKYQDGGHLKCEIEKWGELKAVAAGTTSIVTLAGTFFPCFSSLARTIDGPQNGFDKDLVQSSALFPPQTDSVDGVCKNYSDGSTDAYLIHCGEGVDAKALAEYEKLRSVSTTPGCLFGPKTAITHGTAFGEAQFTEMGATGMKLTWSPASNIALYGQTTNIPLALDKNIVVSLAPDWSMGGSQNLLDEMRFAKKWSDDHWDGRLKGQDVLRMTTENAAKVLGLDARIGKIAKGYAADLFVVVGDKTKPYDALLAATPKNVSMTMVGGKLIYGDPVFRKIASNTALCDDFDACGAPHFFCVATESAETKLNQRLGEIETILNGAITELDAISKADGFDFAPIAPVVRCPAE